MSFLAQYQNEIKTIVGVLKPASSPHRWKQIIAPRIKPALEAGYCFNWVKQIDINPKIHSGLIIGDCLSNALSGYELNNESESGPEKPKHQSLQPLPVFEATNFRKDKPGEAVPVKATKATFNTRLNESTHTKRESSNLNKPTGKVKSSNTSQVYRQQKTANLAYLQNWINEGNEQDKNTLKKNENTLRISNKKKPTEAVTNANLKRKQRPAPLALNKNDSSARWQQQVNQRIRKLLVRIKPEQTNTKNDLAWVIPNLPDSDKLLWNQLLCQDDESAKRVSIDSLNSILKPEYRQTKNNSNAKQSGSSDPKNEIDSLLNSNTHKDFLHRTNLGKSEKPAKDSLHRTQSEAVDKSENRPVEFKPDSSKQPGNISPANSVTSEQKGEVKNYSPSIEAPEFPPVKKNIIEELQPSGKRTALKSESINQNQTEMDEHQLAETLKRIIDEQARRQGINV